MAETPKYRQIADDLREKIVSGEWPSGSKVPSENALMESHGVARSTVRQAIAVLRSEGLVDTFRGSQSTVRNFRPVVRIETKRASKGQWGTGRSMWENDLDGRELTIDFINVSRGIAPGPVARVLGTSDTIIRTRRYLINKQPSLVATSYLPADIAAGTRIAEVDTGEGGIYGLLADLGHDPIGFSMQVWSRPPRGEEDAQLKLPANAWVLAAVRTAFDEAGRAVEVNEMALDPSIYVLQFDFTA